MSGTGGPASSSPISLSALSASSISRPLWPLSSPAATSAALISSRSLSSALTAALVVLRLGFAGGGAGAGAAAAAAAAAAASASRAFRAALRSTGILSHGAPWPRLRLLLHSSRDSAADPGEKLRRGEADAAARGGWHRDRDAG
nr:unnamed protein product [Digitaria exilis]